MQSIQREKERWIKHVVDPININQIGALTKIKHNNPHNVRNKQSNYIIKMILININAKDEDKEKKATIVFFLYEDRSTTIDNHI